MTRRRKLILLLVVAPLALLALLVVALLTPAVQTFVARRVLAGQGGVGHVSVGAGGAEITGLTLEQPGVKISVPGFKVDLPLFAASRGDVDVQALVARDIVIDYDQVAAADYAKKHPKPVEPAAPSKPFDGLLKALELPGDLQVNGIDLSGVLRVVGAQPVDVNFNLTGGGVAAGKQGKVELKLTVKANQSPDAVVTVLLQPSLDDEGQLSALSLALDATAQGGLLAKSTSLRTEASVLREGAGGESWSLRLVAADKALIEIDTKWAPGSSSLPGRWKLDLTDTDLKPFIPVFNLPGLQVAGAGELALSGTERLKLSGAIKLAVDRLESFGLAEEYRTAGVLLAALGLVDMDKLRLPALGPVSVATTFDVDATAAETKVGALRVDVSAADAPVFAVEAKQAFTYAIATKKLSSTAPAEELIAVRLIGVPSAWVTAFAPPELALGAPLSGAWSVRPEGDGVVIDSTAPFLLSAVRYGSAAKPLAAFDSVQVDGLHLRQGPAGLDATVDKIRLVVGGADVLTAKVTATQKTGEPLVAHTEIRAQLAALADQPAAKGQTRLSAGQALLTLDATVGDAQKVGAQLRFTGLRAVGEVLPEVLLDLTADRNAAGVITARLPIMVTNASPKRISDIELTATFTPGSPDAQVVAKLVSQVLHLPDLQVFSTLAAESAPPPAVEPAKDASVEPAPAPTGPLWAGLAGELELSLARLVQAPGIEITDIKGRVALTKDALTLDKLGIVLGTGGRIGLAGALRWIVASKSYTLAADVKGDEVVVGPLLKALNPAASVPLEGTYALSATVAGTGADPGAAAAGAAADLKLSGKQGVLRALDLDTNKYTKAGSTVAGFAGLLGAATGNAELAKRGAQITALNNVARQFTNLPYDEFALSARRGADGAVEIGELTLLSPRLRLAGSGGLQNLPGRSLVQQPLSLKLELGARDTLARDLDTLGLVEPMPAGANGETYAQLIEPVVLDGTLSKIGTDQLLRLLTRKLTGR